MTIFGMLIIIFAVWAVIDAIRGTLSTQKKILWTFLIVLLPMLGSILYVLMGKTEV